MAKPLKRDKFGIWVHDHSARKPPSRKMRPAELVAKERRDPIRRAYFIIRDDPAKRDLVTTFARALGGKTDITDDMLHEAAVISNGHRGGAA